MKSAVYLCPPGDSPPRVDASDCPYNDVHEIGPESTLEWWAWADEMSKKNKNLRCPGCGLFKIIVPKSAAIKVRREHG